MNCELQMFKLDLQKEEEPEIKLPTFVGSSKKQEFPRNINFCFIDYAKAFDCVGHNKQWKILQEMGLSDHLTCLLKNMYAGQETTVRIGHGTTDWFSIGKGPLQYSCLENPRDRGAWWAAIYGVTQSWTRLKRLSSSSSVLIPACASSSPTFLMMYSAYKLNKQGDNIQP